MRLQQAWRSVTQAMTFSRLMSKNGKPVIFKTNQQLDIYGCDAHEIVKHVTPSFTLKLSHFFEKFKGDLIFHPHENIVCYLGEHDLFRLQSKHMDIQEISHLRGHLRTLNMLEYDLFKERISPLLS